MDFMEYKNYHEAQMTDNIGSSVFEIEAILTTVSAGVFICVWLKICGINSFTSEFICIILPVTFEVTILSSQSFILPLFMLLILITISSQNINVTNIIQILSSKVSNRKSYVTNYRASTNLVSALCILAVDFNIFPRRFAKTETFGFGLMDLGVGYFICSNGMVTKSKTYSPNFWKVVKSTSALIILGFIRLCSVKSIDYHEHASEYGVHWNFFFTLGFCRIISYVASMISPVKQPLVLSCIIGFLHQFLLCSGLEEWVFSNVQRNTFLSANREGISSLLGYVSLFFASVAIGQMINNEHMSYQKLLTSLFLLCLTLWSFTGVSFVTVGVSRRLANVGYNFWIMSSTVTVLLEFVLIDIAITGIMKNMEQEIKNSSHEPKNVVGQLLFKQFTQTPTLMESINTNGLFFFLFANLLTGVVNLLFQTLLLGSAASVLILIFYMTTVCVIPFIFYCKNWVLKFW